MADVGSQGGGDTGQATGHGGRHRDGDEQGRGGRRGAGGVAGQVAGGQVEDRSALLAADRSDEAGRPDDEQGKRKDDPEDGDDRPRPDHLQDPPGNSTVDEAEAERGDDRPRDGRSHPPSTQRLMAGGLAGQCHERRHPAGLACRPQDGDQGHHGADQDRQGEGGPGDGQVTRLDLLDEAGADDGHRDGGSDGGSGDRARQPSEQGGAQHRAHDLTAGRAHAAQQTDLAGLARHERREGRGDDDPGDDDAHGGEDLQKSDRPGGGAVGALGAHSDDLGGGVCLCTWLRGGQGPGDGAEKLLVAGPRLPGDVEDGGGVGKPHGGLSLAGGEDVGGVLGVVPGDVSPGPDHADNVHGRGGGVLGGPQCEGAADLHVLLPLQDGGGDGDLVIRLRQAALHQAGAARERRYVQDQEIALLSRAPAPGQDPSLDIGAHRCDPVSRGDLLHGPLGDPASGGVVLVVRQDHHVGVTDTGAGALGDPGPNGVGDDEDEDDEGRTHGHRHESGSTAA